MLFKVWSYYKVIYPKLVAEPVFSLKPPKYCFTLLVIRFNTQNLAHSTRTATNSYNLTPCYKLNVSKIIEPSIKHELSSAAFLHLWRRSCQIVFRLVVPTCGGVHVNFPTRELIFSIIPTSHELAEFLPFCWTKKKEASAHLVLLLLKSRKHALAPFWGSFFLSRFFFYLFHWTLRCFLLPPLSAFFAFWLYKRHFPPLTFATMVPPL